MTERMGLFDRLRAEFTPEQRAEYDRVRADMAEHEKFRPCPAAAVVPNRTTTAIQTCQPVDLVLRDVRACDAMERSPTMTDPRITKEMIEMLAKRMADTASDWLHNDCGDDEHGLEHSNWEAYTEDAKHALEAVLALLPEPEWEYLVDDREGDVWAMTDTLEEARHYAAQEPGAVIEQRMVHPWHPVPDTNEGEK